MTAEQVTPLGLGIGPDLMTLGEGLLEIVGATQDKNWGDILGSDTRHTM